MWLQRCVLTKCCNRLAFTGLLRLHSWQSAHCPASQSLIRNQNGATSEFVMCFAPSTFVAGGPNQKTRLESSTKKLKLHLIYDCFSGAPLFPAFPLLDVRPANHKLHHPAILGFQNGAQKSCRVPTVGPTKTCLESRSCNKEV